MWAPASSSFIHFLHLSLLWASSVWNPLSLYCFISVQSPFCPLSQILSHFLLCNLQLFILHIQTIIISFPNLFCFTNPCWQPLMSSFHSMNLIITLIFHLNIFVFAITIIFSWDHVSVPWNSIQHKLLIVYFEKTNIYVLVMFIYLKDRDFLLRNMFWTSISVFIFSLLVVAFLLLVL